MLPPSKRPQTNGQQTNKETLIRNKRISAWFLDCVLQLEELFPNYNVLFKHIGISNILSCDIMKNGEKIGRIDFCSEDANYWSSSFTTGEAVKITHPSSKEEIEKAANQLKMNMVLNK